MQRNFMAVFSKKIFLEKTKDLLFLLLNHQISRPISSIWTDVVFSLYIIAAAEDYCPGKFHRISSLNVHVSMSL